MISLERARKLRTVALAVAGSAAVALTGVMAGPAAAAPEPAPAPAGITMVNGTGKTVTLPAQAATALKSAAGGRSGSLGAATGKTEPGTFGTNSVIGPDGRVQESIPSTFPWGGIAHLETNQGGCTGFMLSRDVLVTAGHCVHFNGSWVTSYTVTPGRTGNSKPFGTCSGGIADVWTTWNWINGYPSDYDYGLVKLTCDIGYSTGWFGWSYNTAENLVGQYLYVEGYPGDKPYGTMWWDGDTAYSQTANKMWYWVDTFGGQSGSPVYRYSSSGPCVGYCVIGIHTNGVVGTNPANSGTRFRPEVMDFINYWISQP